MLDSDSYKLNKGGNNHEYETTKRAVWRKVERMKPPQIDKMDEDHKLRVWWFTDRTPRYYYVTDIAQAMLVLAVLAKREVDDETIGMNASGLEVYSDREWTEWMNDDGLDIKELIDELDAHHEIN